MTDSIDIKTRLPTRVGLSSHAIFRLWKTALKDDETLLDEAIASVYEQMISLDQARAEQVMSLIIRRHRDAKEAFKAMLMAIRTQSRPPTETLSTARGTAKGTATLIRRRPATSRAGRGTAAA